MKLFSSAYSHGFMNLAQKLKRRMGMSLLLGCFFMPHFSLAQENANNIQPIKGYVCSAILSNAKVLFPTLEQQQKNTKNTIQQLWNFLTFQLRSTLATPTFRKFEMASSLENLSAKNSRILAQQLAGVIYDFNQVENADHLLNFAFTLHGKDSIESYFDQLSKSVSGYHDLVKNDDIYSDQRFNLKNIPMNQLIYGSLTVYELNYLLNKFSHHFTMNSLEDVGYGLILLWYFLAEFSEDLNRHDQAMVPFLKNLRQFLNHPSAGKRVLYFSNHYKILPATFDQAWASGTLRVETLVKESESSHQRPIPNPFDLLREQLKLQQKPLISHVRVDYFIESSGLEDKDVSLHVVIRANKTKPLGPPSQFRKRVKDKVQEVVEQAKGSLLPKPAFLPQ